MNNRPRYLTKSRYKTALECPTKLFYTQKQDEYANVHQEDEFLLALAEGGFQVGELAKYYHPGGHDITSLSYEKSLEETNALLKQENVIIYEPAILFEDFFIRVDILVKTGNKIDLIEVKAKSCKSKEDFYSDKGYIASSWRPYLYDIAFQNWVTQRAFPHWDITPFLMLADQKKKTTVDGLNQLFIITKDAKGRKGVKVHSNITNELLGDEILVKVDASNQVQMIWDGKDIDPIKKTIEDQMDFADRVRLYSNYYKDDRKYPVSLGLKCKHCEFKNDNEQELKSGFEECWKSVYTDFDSEEPHVFGIWNFRKAAKLIEQEIIYQKDIYEGGFVNELNPRQLLQVDKTVNRLTKEDVKPELFTEMDSWKFPLHFIDFESSMVAVPFHKKKHPYEQIAFQFSCHTLYEDGHVTHDEWIESIKGKFPNYDFIKALKKVLDKDNGTIFRYAAHENTVLRQIQKQMENKEEEFSEWIQWIDTITEWQDKETKKKYAGERNMVDLLKLIKQYYYHPEMKGSNSIKAVLPAIFTTSKYIKNRYSKPVGFGNNLKDIIMWQLDRQTCIPQDPYKLLPDKYQDLDMTNKELVLENGKIQDGAAAMMAFGKMQFTDMDEQELSSLINALLQYCELDTLAMLMIYEHWRSLI